MTTVFVRCKRSVTDDNPEGWVEGIILRTTKQQKTKRVRKYIIQLKQARNVVRCLPSRVAFTSADFGQPVIGGSVVFRG